MNRSRLSRYQIHVLWLPLFNLIFWLSLVNGDVQAQDKTQLAKHDLPGTDIFQLLTDPLNRNFENICGEGSAPGRSLRQICDVVVASPICRNVSQADRLNCATFEEQRAPGENFWDYLVGCGNGALSAVESIWNMLKAVVDFLVNEAMTQIAKSQEKLKALKEHLESTKLYVATEYQKALDESSPPFAEWKALHKVGGDLVRILMEIVKQALQREMETFSCLNPKAQAQAICSLLFPPEKVTALLKYGPEALRKIPELKAVIEDLHGNHRAKPPLPAEAPPATPILQQLRPEISTKEDAAKSTSGPKPIIHNDESADGASTNSAEQDIPPIGTKAVKVRGADIPALRVTKQSMVHMGQHAIPDELLEEIKALKDITNPSEAEVRDLFVKLHGISRLDTVTSVFAKSRQLRMIKNFDVVELQPDVSNTKRFYYIDPKTGKYLRDDNGQIKREVTQDEVPRHIEGYYETPSPEGGYIFEDSQGKYTLAVCLGNFQAQNCPDDRKPGVRYEPGDVISLYPICGTDVLRVPKSSDVERCMPTKAQPRALQSCINDLKKMFVKCK